MHDVQQCVLQTQQPRKYCNRTAPSAKYPAHCHVLCHLWAQMKSNKPHQAPKRKPQKRNDYRLILQEEGTFAEKWALRVKPGQLRWMATATVIAIIGLTYAVVALTPLREWVVPGYVSTETRQMQKDAWMATDSLSRELDIQAQYLENMIAVIEGRMSPESLLDTAGQNPSSSNPVTTAGPNASLERLRMEVAEEDAFSIGRSGGLDDTGLWLSPVDGQVSDGWNPAVEHWGIDLVAPENSPVKAAGAGSVVFAGFTAGGGHTVILQHLGDKLSVYMHNSRLEVRAGDRVVQGEVIAIIGNSGDHSTGPHLHFEWWENGAPIDPALRINLVASK